MALVLSSVSRLQMFIKTENEFNALLNPIYKVGFHVDKTTENSTASIVGCPRHHGSERLSHQTKHLH